MLEIEEEGVLVFMFGVVIFFLGIFGGIIKDLDASFPFIDVIVSLCSIMMIVGAVLLIMLGMLVVIMMIHRIMSG